MLSDDNPSNKTVTKKELVTEIAQRLGFAQNEVAEVVQATFDTITEALRAGRRLEIRNFGVFDVRKRNPRKGRNPRTGIEVHIEEKRVPTFKAGKTLKEKVMKGITSESDGASVPQSEISAIPPSPPSSEVAQG